MGHTADTEEFHLVVWIILVIAAVAGSSGG